MGSQPSLWQVRSWQQGECLVFDDSYEHEVWHEAGLQAGLQTGLQADPQAETPPVSRQRPRTVLIIDIWHPALSIDQRRSLLGGGPEGERYGAIMRGEALPVMSERELSDGTVRKIGPTYRKR